MCIIELRFVCQLIDSEQWNKSWVGVCVCVGGRTLLFVGSFDIAHSIMQSCLIDMGLNYQAYGLLLFQVASGVFTDYSLDIKSSYLLEYWNATYL